MALIGHPIVGDRRYSYSYAKQYSQHHWLPQDDDQGGQDSSPEEDSSEGNSASVALKRCRS